MSPKKLDTVGWYIATLHQMLGHQTTAGVLGQDPGNRDKCILCRYEQGKATRDEVVERLGMP